jgi:hypothetical protein
MSEKEGDERAISAIWVVIDASGRRIRHIEFEGLDEGGVLPIERA